MYSQPPTMVQIRPLDLSLCHTISGGNLPFHFPNWWDVIRFERMPVNPWKIIIEGIDESDEFEINGPFYAN